MLRTIAFITGIIFIVFAVLGFMPEFVSGNKLFGIFAVNTLHNFMHLVVGIVALLCSLKSMKASRYFFIGLGLIFGMMALTGLYDDSVALFRYIATNSANTWLRAAIAALSLYIAITFSRKKSQD